nr:uncharacterized protein LOC118971616 [Manis javanica]
MRIEFEGHDLGGTAPALVQGAPELARRPGPLPGGGWGPHAPPRSLLPLRRGRRGSGRRPARGGRRTTPARSPPSRRPRRRRGGQSSAVRPGSSSWGWRARVPVSSSRQRRDAEFALDAWMFPVGDEVCSRIPQPFFISSEWFQYPANIIKMKKCYLPGRERKMIAIRRTEAVARRKHMPAEARVWVQRMGGSFPTEVVRRSCLEDTGTELDLQQRDGEERSGYFRQHVCLLKKSLCLKTGVDVHPEDSTVPQSHLIQGHPLKPCGSSHGTPCFQIHNAVWVICEAMLPPRGTELYNVHRSVTCLKHLHFTELQKDFDRWDSLIEGEDDNLIPGTNIDTINQYVSLQNSTRIEKYNLD